MKQPDWNKAAHTHSSLSLSLTLNPRICMNNCTNSSVWGSPHDSPPTCSVNVIYFCFLVHDFFIRPLHFSTVFHFFLFGYKYDVCTCWFHVFVILFHFHLLIGMFCMDHNHRSIKFFVHEIDRANNQITILPRRIMAQRHTHTQAFCWVAIFQHAFSCQAFARTTGLTIKTTKKTVRSELFPFGYLICTI